jgi:hypothetical protein
MSTPARSLNSSQAIGLIVPVPNVAALILPGLAFAYAISRDDHGL